jgi:hypothetical protein
VNFFYKLQNWFESIQSLFAKKIQTNSEKKWGKEKRKEEKGPGVSSGPDRENGPWPISPSLPKWYALSLFFSLMRGTRLVTPTSSSTPI